MTIISIKEFSFLAGVPTQTIDYWCKTNKINRIDVDGRVCFDKESVVSFIEKRREEKDNKEKKKSIVFNNGIKCLICGEQTKYQNYKLFTRHHLYIDHSDVSTKQYYDKYILKYKENVCPLCNKEKGFISILNGYHDYCSDLLCNSKNEEIKIKISKTFKEKYGDSSYRNVDKHKETCLKKYGYEFYTNRQKFKKTWKCRTEQNNNESLLKSKKTRFDRYGYENYVNKEEISRRKVEKYIVSVIPKLEKFNCKIIEHKLGIISFSCSTCNKNSELSSKFLYSRLICDKCPCINCFPVNDSKSQIENDIAKFIKDNYDGMVICSDREILGGKELDIVIPDKKIALEINGTYWHSSEIKDRNYHAEKTKKCLESGYRLLHIFEDQWIHKKDILMSKILNVLGKTNIKIMARKCEIRVVESIKEQKEFLEENHIQGWSNNRISYGIFYNCDLVGIMCFDTPRTNKKYQWELTRYATKKDIQLCGGASRLLSHFIKQQNPDNIISYADSSFSNGNMYEKINFKLVHMSKPSFFYVDKVSLQRFHRFRFNKKNLIKMGLMKDSETCDAAMSRYNRYHKIYDCGKYLYLWSKE